MDGGGFFYTESGKSTERGFGTDAQPLWKDVPTTIDITLLLYVLFIPKFFTFTMRRGGPLEKAIVFAIIAYLLYNTYLACRQHEFYIRWERGMGLLLHLEEENLKEDK